jgi:hypothetical protein
VQSTSLAGRARPGMLVVDAGEVVAAGEWDVRPGNPAVTPFSPWVKMDRQLHPKAIHSLVHSPFGPQTVRIRSNSGPCPS